jgi:membrane protein implicated in regulation of membrane protease activity
VNHIYLFAVAAGVTLLVASLLLGGKDTDHGAHGHDASLGWAPFASLRFWVFFLAFGGGAGFALDALGSSETIAAIGAIVVGWASGAIAVAVVKMVTKRSVSSDVGGAELVGSTGLLVLPVGPGKPGKVRVDIKGRTEDFVANIVDDGEELPTGTPVLVVAEGDRGSLLVAKGEM